MDDTLQLGFPLWVRLTHFFNFLFITLLIRSGIEIIGAHPKFYWNDDALPGSEWFRLTKKRIPKNQLWTSEDEIEPMPRWTALPGDNNLGLGRHWHFWAVNGWLLAGLMYVILLFTTPQWRRLVPKHHGTSSRRRGRLSWPTCTFDCFPRETRSTRFSSSPTVSLFLFSRRFKFLPES